MTQPLDQLMLTFLRLDMPGRVLADVTSKMASPIRLAQRSLVDLLSLGLVGSLVSEHFNMTDDEKRSHMTLMRSMIVEIAACVYYRVDAVSLRLVACSAPGQE